MASPCLPPALLQCLGKHQAPGLWDLRRGEVKNQRPTLQHHQLIHPQTLTEKAMPLVSIIYLPIYIHIPNLGRGTQAARAQPTSLVGVGGGRGLPHPKPRPHTASQPHKLQRAEQTLFRFIGYTRCGSYMWELPCAPSALWAFSHRRSEINGPLFMATNKSNQNTIRWHPRWVR